jgi:adenylate cyclase
MADVFVSYARPDELLAERVAESLRAKGYQVWRDDELPAHRAYATSSKSGCRRHGRSSSCGPPKPRDRSGCARKPMRRVRPGTLIQAKLDGSTPPLPFNQIQCADLSGWNGKDDTPGWRKLLQSVIALAGEQRTAAAPKKSRRAAPSRSASVSCRSRT